MTNNTQRSTVTISVLLLVAHCAVASASTYYQGDGTVYTLSEPSDGNCNFMAWPDAAVTKYAALNTEQWDSTMNCGRCAEVSCTDASCSGQSSEIVYIMDQCPGCAYGDLDLSPDVFESITGQSYTRLSIQWKFVDCPISSNVQYCLKTGSSDFWVAVQPANFVSGVESLTINGQETAMVDSAYYFLVDGSGQDVADLSQVTISMVGLNGEVLEETVSLTADACTEGSSQFSSSGDDSQTDTTSQATIVSSPAATTDTPTATPTATSIPTPTATSTPTPTASTGSLRSSTSSEERAASVADATTSASASNVGGESEVSSRSWSSSSASEVGDAEVTTISTAIPTSTPTPTEGAVHTDVQSGGGSHTTPLMIGMIVLVCGAVVAVVLLALYVRRRKQQIDAYKRREAQGTAMSDEDVSPRASNASSAYDMVQSPTVQFAALDTMGRKV